MAKLMYVRFPLSLRNVEDLLSQRGIDVSYETVRFWWNRFGPMHTLQKFAAGHASFNHFATERHLSGRDQFKADRSAALAQWRALAA